MPSPTALGRILKWRGFLSAQLFGELLVDSSGKNDFEALNFDVHGVAGFAAKFSKKFVHIVNQR